LYHLLMHLNRYTVHVLEHFRNDPAIRTVPAGMTLFKAGDAADFVYILVDGQANLLVGKTVVEVAGRGNLLGEVALIDGKPRSATVVTRTQCQVLPIDAAQFHALMREMPAFSDYVMNAMAERMRRMNDNLRAAQTVEGVDARVTTNTSLSMEDDATLPPTPPKRGGG
jgi:CRP/FNR family transcriptional regulator, cyclic AMP receptor protein